MKEPDYVSKFMFLNLGNDCRNNNCINKPYSSIYKIWKWLNIEQNNMIRFLIDELTNILTFIKLQRDLDIVLCEFYWFIIHFYII